MSQEMEQKWNALFEEMRRLDEKVRTQGLHAFSTNERLIFGIIVAWGGIENGGLHRYSTSVDHPIPPDEVVTAFHRIDLPEAAQCLADAFQLMMQYVGTIDADAPVNPDEFRRRFSDELNEIEGRLYPLGDSVASQLYDRLERG